MDTTVFGGMSAAAAIGIFLTLPLCVVFQRLREKIRGETAAGSQGTDPSTRDTPDQITGDPVQREPAWIVGIADPVLTLIYLRSPSRKA